ncbi:MAG: antibiotic biosynthesis monooxygenase [Desulfobacteraceae bacterium]|nr:antibiotic biosynthesis monooxygenase [Desulfobacteraceae bacterium]
MIISSLKIVVPAKKRKEIQRAFYCLLPFVRLQSGCLSCYVYQDLENKEAIFLHQEWQTSKDLYRHIRSELYKKTLALIDLSDKPPEIKFNHVSSASGMELIREVRGQE